MMQMSVNQKKREEMRLLVVLFGALVALGAFAGELAVVTNTFVEAVGGDSTWVLDASKTWKLGYDANDAKYDNYVFLCNPDSMRMMYPGVNSKGQPSTRTPRGNAWQFGVVGDAASPQFYLRLGWLVFPNDGLFLAKGSMSLWTDGASEVGKNNDNYYQRRIGGTVTVLAPTASAYMLKFNGATTTNCYYHFAARMVGAAGTKLTVAYNTGVAHNNGIKFSGNLTDFQTDVVVGEKLFCELGSDVVAQTFPGSLTLGTSSELRLAAGAADVSVGKVQLGNAGSLRFGAKAVDGVVTIANLQVTGELEFLGEQVPIKVSGATFGGYLPTNQVFTILTAPQGTGLSPERFSLDVSELASEGGDWSLQTDVDAAGNEVLQLKRGLAFVYFVANMTTGQQSPFNVLGDVWSDGMVPHPGVLYYVPAKTVRTEAGKAHDDFPGEAFVLQAGSTFVTQAQNTHIGRFFTVPNSSANSTYATICNWHTNGDKTTNVFAVGGTKTISGQLTMMHALSISQNANGSYFNLMSDITGSMDTKMNLTLGNSVDGMTTWFELSGDNRNWLGYVFAEPVVDANGPRTAPDYANTLILTVTRPESLGGPRPTPKYDSLILSKKALLRAARDLTLDDPTRGVLIASTGGGFTVDAGATLTLKEQLTVQAPSVGKLGLGTLALGGRLAFGNVATYEPVAGYDVLDVLEGSVKAVAKDAFNGLSITMAAGSELLVDTPDKLADDMRSTGFVNTKASVPFVLPSDGILRVALDVAREAAPYANEFSVPICTVTAAAAGALRGKIVVRGGYRGYRATVTETADAADGTVTFVANFWHTGLVLFIR